MLNQLFACNKRILDSNFRQNRKKFALLTVFFLFFLLTMYRAYFRVVIGKWLVFFSDPNPLKIALGVLCVLGIFFFVNHFEKKASVFLYEIYYYIMVIPIAIMYGCCNFSTIYFVMVIIPSLIVLLFLNVTYEDLSISLRIKSIERSNHLIVLLAVFCLAFVILFSLFVYGFPQLTAFDLSRVYELRRSSSYAANRYFGYLLKWTHAVIIPFLLGLFLCRKQRIGALITLFLGVGLYLYTGEKIIVFSLPMVIMVYVISRFRKSNYLFEILFNGGFIGINALALAGTTVFYDYLTRRVMLLPAYLKFLYYDYFSSHPKVGLAGTLWGSALGQSSPYDIGLGYVISRYYFHNDIMNSNTGFLAEGYYRFGFAGILLVMFLFFIFLKLVDQFAIRNSFSLAVSVCAFPVFSLNDGPLIDSLIFGPFTLLLLILLFFSEGELKRKNDGREIVLLYQ